MVQLKTSNIPDVTRCDQVAGNWSQKGNSNSSSWSHLVTGHSWSQMLNWSHLVTQQPGNWQLVTKEKSHTRIMVILSHLVTSGNWSHLVTNVKLVTPGHTTTR